MRDGCIGWGVVRRDGCIWWGGGVYRVRCCGEGWMYRVGRRGV